MWSRHFRKPTFQRTARKRYFLHDLFDGKALTGALPDQAHNTRDHLIVHRLDIGRHAAHDVNRWDVDPLFGRRLSSDHILKQGRGIQSDRPCVGLYTRQRWTAKIAEQIIVVHADDTHFGWDINARLLAAIEYLPSASNLACRAKPTDKSLGPNGCRAGWFGTRSAGQLARLRRFPATVKAAGRAKRRTRGGAHGPRVSGSAIVSPVAGVTAD